MANFYTDNEDLNFYLERAIDWQPLVAATEFGSGESPFASTEEARDFYRDIALLVGAFVAEEIAPHAAAIDRDPPRFVDGDVVFPARMQLIFDRIRELELHGMCLPREVGGMNCPLLLSMINAEMFARADVSVMAHHGFHGGMALAMLIFSIREGSTTIDLEKGELADTRFADYIAEIVRGDAWGSMDITEPDAGSDMAALRTVGEQDDAGQWFVSGQKIFITSGHGRFHFVIARTEKAAAADDPMAGLDGLSMFLVPAFEDDGSGGKRWLATVDRLEEKLGHHGSATVSVTFDKTPGHLIGERGDGFRHMLTLMNNARLMVGFESLGLCEAAYRLARDYAAERRSMGKTIDRHEMIADLLDEMRTDIQGIRALAMSAAVDEELAQKLALGQRFVQGDDALARRRTEQVIEARRTQSRRVTPLIKYIASEKAVEMARRCMQIHGGNGYMQEFGAEKLLRDALVMPIYEGTSQIQALMAMRDCLMGIMKAPQNFVRRLAQARWRSLSSRDPLERRLARIQMLSLGAQQHLLARTAAAKVRGLSDRPVSEWPRAFFKDWDPKRDFSLAMLHAARLTELLADEAICEVLFEQGQAYPERREVLERYIDRAEPRCRFLHDEITSTGTRLLAQLDGETTVDDEQSATA